MRLTKTRITKNQYLKAFSACVLLLAFIRAIFPEVASTKEEESHHLATDSAKTISRAAFLSAQPVKNGAKMVTFFKADGSPVKNRIRSVPDFSKAFPDLNDVQLEEAHRYGVPPVANRQEAERRKSELVYMLPKTAAIAMAQHSILPTIATKRLRIPTVLPAVVYATIRLNGCSAKCSTICAPPTAATLNTK